LRLPANCRSRSRCRATYPGALTMMLFRNAFARAGFGIAVVRVILVP